MTNSRSDIGIIQDMDVISYPDIAPFSPATIFPEYPFAPDTCSTDLSTGKVYHLVRRLFTLLQYDIENLETPKWNPLGHIIRPGDTVLLKPNMVRDYHGKNGDLFSVITHGSIIRAVLDYVWIALHGKGTIIIGDAPVQGANFDNLITRNGLDKIVKFYSDQGVNIVLRDFRQFSSELTKDRMITTVNRLTGDPCGYAVVGFGSKSWLAKLNSNGDRFRVTQYDAAEMIKHHNAKTHEYLVAKSVLEADVVINLPKMKTHRKVGITATMKNLVGINGSKDWLPHHRYGSISEGGDEFLKRNAIKSLQSRLRDIENNTQNISLRKLYHFSTKALGRVGRLARHDGYHEGGWYGNDTAWRMTLDLNRILLYAAKDGSIQNTPQRKVFHVMDGIIAGEGEGPLEPTAKPVGVLVAGNNSVAVDAVVARLMGFDYRKIPMIRNAFSDLEFVLAECAPEDIQVVSNLSKWNQLQLTHGSDSLNFEPSSGWKGYIELEG